MTYEELVKEVKKNYSTLDASEVKEHVAVQFNVEGEAEGAFYIEIAEGKADVEPYEYYDRDAVVTTSADVAVKLSTKKLSLKEAYDDEKAKVWGDFDKILYAFDQLKVVKEASDSKATTAKKASTKKTTKKTTTKASSKKTSTAGKSTTKKAGAAK